MSRQKNKRSGITHAFKKQQIHISLFTTDQLNGLYASGIRPDRLYIDSALVRQTGTSGLLKKICEGGKTELYLALPYILREEKDFDGSIWLRQILEDVGIIKTSDDADSAEKMKYDGVLVRNIEELAIIKRFCDDASFATDYGMYMWNSQSVSEAAKWGAESVCLPYELNMHELRDLFENSDNTKYSLCIYGRIPMMVSANCIARTSGSCSGKPYSVMTKELTVKDRVQHEMPVTAFCGFCYNIIWNYVPSSLHKQLPEISKSFENCALRIDLTVEDRMQTEKVLGFWDKSFENGICGEPPYSEYTTGHFRRGVE